MEELEWLRPGIVNELGTLMITEKESTIPHFDVIRDDGTKISIMIQENRYMPNETNYLTEEECKRLNEWAHSNEKKEWWNTGAPNWNNMIICWNGLYNDYELKCDPTGKSIPDYTTIRH